MAISDPRCQRFRFSTAGGPAIPCVLYKDHPGDCDFGGVGPISNTVDPIGGNIDPVKLADLLDKMRRERDWIYAEAEHLADFAGFQTNALRLLRKQITEVCDDLERVAGSADAALLLYAARLRGLIDPPKSMPMLGDDV